MGRDIIFYKTVEGKCPVEEFLDSLPSKAAQKAAWVLSLAEAYKQDFLKRRKVK